MLAPKARSASTNSRGLRKSTSGMVKVPLRCRRLDQLHAIVRACAAMRRAADKFDGLLTSGRNRKTLELANRVGLRKRCILKLLGEPSNPAGGTLLIIRRLIVPLTMAVIAVQAPEARAQGALPAPW